jgi:UDP-N-acetylglucosamine 4,6-dehydratase
VNYFITGGTGTIGREIVSLLLGDTKMCAEKIVVYSRDEQKHAEMMNLFPEGGESGLRYIVGDICDYSRLLYAMDKAGVVIHTAAMKHIDKCEYNPTESVRINVIGSMNVAKACRETGVQQAVIISTDKACNPISAYGAQKYAAERLWIGMNNLSSKTMFNVVRYGNVLGSRGSFIYHWQNLLKEKKPIQITDENMTRFFWTVHEAGKFILSRITDGFQNRDRGLVYIPKMGKCKIIDMAKSLSENIEIVGMRCPEKIHEEMISITEGASAYDCGDHYIIYPLMHDWCRSIIPRGCKCPEGFRLTSEV